MKIRRRDKRVWFVLVGVFVAVFLFTFLTQRFKVDGEAGALKMAGFDPGYIISDYQMSRYNSMSEAEIQAFLKSKNSCNNTNVGGYTNGAKVDYYSEISPPSTWHVAGGHFVCLADENINGVSAAHIIWQAAQDYRINPQVLIVLLEKEQSLITDTFPYSGQYRSATGYGCPDTAACSSKYYGFENQVRNAAALFRTVLDGGWTNYPLGNNYVQYNPNAACGGSVVNIRSLATSALYRYTPYQPNASVLAGGNDGCGAYGNVNFYGLFEEWFGNIKWDGYQPLSTVLSNNRVASAGSDLGVAYRTYLEHYGWLDWVDNGAMSGTSGYSVQMEALQISLGNRTDGGIEYRAHVKNIGWMDYVSGGKITGTTEKSLQVEAIQVRLTGELSKRYDVYYRVHVKDIGWMDWVKNDEIAGTVGKSKQVEAIQIRIMKKKVGIGPIYQAHVANIGWMGQVSDGVTAGTTGRALQVEGVKVTLPSELTSLGDIIYQAHVANIGWMDWVKNGELAGTTGRALRVEAIRIKLSDVLAEKYDVYYRAHVKNIGWMDWVKNGELAGTTGRALRVEAIQVELVAK